MSETINGVSILSAETKRALVADVQFFETYTSAAFNRKMRGIVKPGFYAGFDAVLAGGLKINITSANEPGKRGVASVDVGEYQISVQQVEDIGFTLPAGATTRVVLEANYQNGVKTNQVDSNSGIQAARLFLADVSVALAGNQLELCRFTVPAGTVNLTQAMLSKQNRPDKSIGIELSNDVEGSNTEGDAYKAATIAALKRALALSVQARGELPDTANLNKYGPTPDRVGQWSKSTATGATIANGFPENDAIGVVEISKAGASNGSQRITLINGNVYSRSLTAAWNGVDGPWGAWNAPYEEAPLPDVWLPLNDSLTMLAGAGPYDRITFGDQYAELTTRSASFLRATTATYIDKSGVLQTAAINEPRFEKEGLLIEASSTNVMLNSDDPTKWASSSSVTKSVLPADGTAQAVTMKGVINAAATVVTFINSAPLPLAVGEMMTVSCRAKGNYGYIRLAVSLAGITHAAVSFDAITGNFYGTSGAVMSVSASLGADGYTTITATLTATEEGNYTGVIAGYKNNSDTTIPLNTEYYVQMPQCEKNPVATSYIPTGAAAVTRAAETLLLPAPCNAGYRRADEMFSRSVSAELTVNRFNAPVNNGYVSVMQAIGVGNNDIVLRIYPTRLIAYRGVDSIGINSSPVFSRKLFTHTIDVKNNVTIYFDGKSASKTLPPFVSDSVPTTINFSAYSACVYHIRNFRIWHSLLNANQAKGLR